MWCSWTEVRTTRARQASVSALRSAQKCAAALMVMFLLAPAAAAANPDNNLVNVAEIGDEKISSDEYVRYLRAYIRSKLYHGGSPELLMELADEALDNMITDRLILREADKRGIIGDDGEVERRLKEIEANYSNKPEWKQIQPELDLIGKEMLRDTQIERLKAAVMVVAPPAEATIRDYYERNENLFTTPASYDTGLILLTVPPSALGAEWEKALRDAREIVDDLRGGADFEALARAWSGHESGAEGGLLEKVHAGQLPAEARTRLKQMASGDVTPPIRVLEGYAVMKFYKEHPPKLRTFEDVAERAERLYIRERSSAQWNDFLAGLRADADVRKYDLSAIVEQMVQPE